MNDDVAVKPVKCPECAKPMSYVRTIWRAFECNIDVWACEPCQKIVREVWTETSIELHESRLEMAIRHVRVGREIVERQRRLIAAQRGRGHSTCYAESLLATFERSLAVFEDDLASLQKNAPPGGFTFRPL
jgi:hypothetical protein